MLLTRRPPSEAAVVDATSQPAGTRDSAALSEALAIIDCGLVSTANRQIVSSDEVSDLLLDLRVVLLMAELDAVGYVTAATN
jgi:Mg-chelatase subunit ChlI